MDIEYEEREEPNEPVGSCDSCGANYYADEDDGSGLCDQCQWALDQSEG